MSVRGEQGQKGGIREQRLPCIGEPPVTLLHGKRGTGDMRRFVWDWLDRHRAKHDKLPHLAVRPLLTPISGASVGGVAAAHADIYVRDFPSGSGCTITTEQGAWRLT